MRYLLLRRRDGGYWQFVAGGGEEGETPPQAARRETREETGIDPGGRLVALDSRAMVSVQEFAASALWPRDLEAIPEYCFAFDAGEQAPRLSIEHTEFSWLDYEGAMKSLRWEGNRNALQELQDKLAGGFGP
jgi:dATP pyrophosphohydrolase